MLDVKKLLEGRKPEEAIALVADVLGSIAALVLPAGAGSASAILAAIKAVLLALTRYQEGGLTASAVRAELERRLKTLQGIDAKIDEQIKKLKQLAGKG